MKNKTEIMKSVNGVASKTVMKLKKHSPEILVMAGIAGTVVSAVLACKATTKVAEILDETKGTLDTIHEGMETGAINGQEYTTEDGKKDTVVVYAQTGMKLAKLYGPAIILGTLSITSILASKYDGDAEFATSLVVFSTLASLISTPIWSYILL